MLGLTLENFRCFKKRQDVSLKPLTLLVGENSTGKTSFLAAIYITAGRGFFAGEHVDFNMEPFSLGAYNEIASYSRGKSGRASFFVIGHEFLSGKNIRLRLLRRFVSEKGQPKLEKITVSDIQGNNYVEATKSEKGKVALSFSDGTTRSGGSYFSAENVISSFNRHFKQEGESIEFMEPYRGITMATAPVRTRPRRTYDPKQDFRRPEGDHIPQWLHDIYADKEKNKDLICEIDAFGQASGLFKSLGVTAYGGEAGPFRINVKISGNNRNITDVGYGVSQVLPFVIETSRYSSGLFLLQQPEIHLHPKAQAELGTYFGKLIKSKRKQIIVETHSDYILDRIRLDIRDKKNGLSSSDVKVLFFNRRINQPWANIYEVDIDEKGDLVKPPREYREFFAAEQKRLFEIN